MGKILYIIILLFSMLFAYSQQNTKSILWRVSGSSAYLNVPNINMESLGWQLTGGAVFKKWNFIEISVGMYHTLKNSDSIVNIQSYFVPVQNNIPSFSLSFGYYKKLKTNLFLKINTGISNYALAPHNDATYYCIYTYNVGLNYLWGNKIFLAPEISLRNNMYSSLLFKMTAGIYLTNKNENALFFNDSLVSDFKDRIIQFNIGMGTSFTIYDLIYLRTSNSTSYKSIQKYVISSDIFFDTYIKWLSIRSIVRYPYTISNDFYVEKYKLRTMNWLLFGFGNFYKNKKWFYGVYWGIYYPEKNKYVLSINSEKISFYDDEPRLRTILLEIGIKKRVFNFSFYLYRLGIPRFNEDYHKAGDKITGYYYYPANIQTSAGIKLGFKI